MSQYQGKHIRHDRIGERRRRCRKRQNRQAVTLLLSLFILSAVVVGGTVAFLNANTSPVKNTFNPSQVSCSVIENFDGIKKSNINVKNTSDIDAYMRVKLVTYRVNGQDQHIGGTADIPEFSPGENWVKNGEYYYYTLPVAPGEKPAADLIGESGIILVGSYNDADGGKQVVEVMAEAIQSVPSEAVGKAWGVSISQGSVTAYGNEGGAGE